MIGPSIAIAACRLSDGSPPDELYPDPDAALLKPALLSAGASAASSVSWDDPRVDWASFDLVVVSGTWDSVDRAEEYLAWTRRVPRLENPADVVAWNLDKRYLRDLDSAGLPIVATTWVEPGDPVPPFAAGDVVVKPAVSAGGRSTAWYSTSSSSAAGEAAEAHVLSLQAAGATVMVQGHVAGVATIGEVKSVYLDGVASHAARVGGLLERDAGTMERPWEKVVPVSPVVPSADERSVADAVVDDLARRFGRPPLYARVDLVLDGAGEPCILEVELIDPLLFLGLARPSAVGRFAAAIVRAAVDGTASSR